MNPFESLQSLAMLWGKTAGEAFADAGQTPCKALADPFGQAAGGGEGASPAPSDAGYEKARQASGDEEVDLNDFRHVGHKPRTAEMAIVMLAVWAWGQVRGRLGK